MKEEKGNNSLNQNINYQNGCNMSKRRYNTNDFDRKNTVVNMNDIKQMFREYMMMKMENDWGEMVRNYFIEKDIINDDK